MQARGSMKDASQRYSTPCELILLYHLVSGPTRVPIASQNTSRSPLKQSSGAPLVELLIFLHTTD